MVRITTDTGGRRVLARRPTAVITGDTKGKHPLCAIEDFIRPALFGMEIEDLTALCTGCIPAL